MVLVLLLSAHRYACVTAARSTSAPLLAGAPLGQQLQVPSACVRPNALASTSQPIAVVAHRKVARDPERVAALDHDLRRWPPARNRGPGVTTVAWITFS